MDTRHEILKHLHKKGETPQRYLVEAVSAGPSRVSQLLSEIEADDEKDEEEGLISREERGKAKIVKIHRKGVDELTRYLLEEESEEAPTSDSPKESSSLQRDSGPTHFDFHKNTIRCEISNLEEVQEEFGDKWDDFWARGWLEKKGIKYKSTPENHRIDIPESEKEALGFYHGGWEVWFTNSHVWIKLEDFRCSAERGDVIRRLQTVMAEGSQALDWLEDETPVEVDRDSARPCFSVREQHLALVEECLAQMICDHPDTNLNNFIVFDESDQRRMWVDNSEGEKHLEFGDNPHGPEDFQFIFQTIYGSMIQNKDGWRQVRDLAESEEDVSQLPDRVNSMEKEVSKVEENVSSLASSLDEVVNVVENDNRGNTGQVQKQVMEVKNTQEQLQEQIQDNTSIQERNNAALVAMTQQLEQIHEELQGDGKNEVIQEQREVIERQQDQISDLSEKLEGLEEKVKDLQEGKDSLSGDQGSLPSPRPLESQSPDIPGDAELESVEIDTEDRSGIGKDALNDTSKQDCSNIDEGMAFKDLRDGGKLLSVWEVNLREGPDGYYDEVKIRVCGTRKVWATMPRAELSRLLDTGRFQITDVPDPPE